MGRNWVPGSGGEHPCAAGDGGVSLRSPFLVPLGKLLLSPGIHFPLRGGSCPSGDTFLVPLALFPFGDGFVSCGRWFHVPLDLFPPRSQFLVPWEPLFVSLRIHSPLGAIFRVLLGLFPCGDGPLGAVFLRSVSLRAFSLSLQLRFPSKTASCPVGDGFTSLWIHFPLGAGSLSLRNHFSCPLGSVSPWRQFLVLWDLFSLGHRFLVPWEQFPSERVSCPFSPLEDKFCVLWEMVSRPFGSISPLGSSFSSLGNHFSCLSGSGFLSLCHRFPQRHFLIVPNPAGILGPPLPVPQDCFSFKKKNPFAFCWEKPFSWFVFFFFFPHP